MAKMQGAEDEGAGSVLKYMTKPESEATKQVGYYDTPPFCKCKSKYPCKFNVLSEMRF